MNFPGNPVNGQQYGSYTYDATKHVWQGREDSATVAVISTVKPAAAKPGDVWYDSSEGTCYVYYNDGDSYQWVELLSSGVPQLNTKANIASPTFTGTVVLPSTTSIGSVSETELATLDGVTAGIQTQINSKANLSGATFTGQINSSYSGIGNHLNLSNVTAGTDQYTNAINVSNDTGYKVIHFLNSSTRTVDGGANGYTIRNDGGPLNLGNSSYNTTISGKVIMPQQPAYSGSIQYASNSANFYPITYDTFNIGFSKSGNNRLTATVAGKYYVAAQQLINGGTYFCIFKNGSEIAHAYANADDTYDVVVSALIDLQVNDYIELYHHGGTITYAWGDAHSRYSVFKVS